MQVYNSNSDAMRTISLLLCLALSTSSFAGDPVKMRQAFKSSYESETAGDYTAAIKALKDVYDAASYECNLRLGWLHYSAGSFSESLSYYQKAIELMPYSVEARMGLTLPASAIGQWDKVAKQYEDILKIDPKNTKANYNLGMILYGKEQYDKALNHFNTGLNLYPYDYDFSLMAAWSNYRVGKMREAKILFEKVLLISPEDASAQEGMGLVK